MDITELLGFSVKQGASDLHIDVLSDTNRCQDRNADSRSALERSIGETHGKQRRGENA